MLYLLLSPDVDHCVQVVDLDHAITPGDLYDLLGCQTLDFFSHDKLYVACDDCGYFNRSINFLASLFFAREIYGPVLIGLLHDPDLPFSDPDLYPLTDLDIVAILSICSHRLHGFCFFRSPKL